MKNNNIKLLEYSIILKVKHPKYINKYPYQINNIEKTLKKIKLVYKHLRKKGGIYYITY